MKNSNRHMGICQVCGKEKKLLDLMPAYSVNNSLVSLIQKKGFEWNNQGYMA